MFAELNLKFYKLGVVPHAFSPNTPGAETEVGGSLRVRPAGLQSKFQDIQVYRVRPVSREK